MIADGWDRSYSLTLGTRVRTHAYKLAWKQGTEARIATTSQPLRAPLFSYTPTINYGEKAPYSQRTWSRAADSVFNNMQVWSRLLSIPTIATDGQGYSTWTGGEREDLGLKAGVVAGGFDGTSADENLVPQAWEIGGADFSTPLPSWMLRQTPTHFYTTDAGYTCVCAPDDLDDISPRSEEVAWCGGSFRIAPNILSAGARGSGPPEARLSPWQPPSNYTDQPAMLSRRSSDGAILATAQISSFERTTLYLAGNAPNNTPNSEMTFPMHYGTLPTLRARAWDTWGPWALPQMDWTVVAQGRYGTSAQYLTAGYVLDVGTPSWLISLDSTLDLNTLTYPEGTSRLYVYTQIPARGYLVCVEGAENCQFPPCGTRSDVGGSVYIPGRQIRVGTVTDAGVVT